MRNGRVVVFLLAGLLSFSFSPILVRLASDAPSVTVATWRTIFAAAVLAPFAARRSASELRGLTSKEWALVSLAGVLLGMHFVAWMESIYQTTVASASVLFTTNPIFIAILGFWLLGERLQRRTVGAIVVAVIGAAMIAVGDASHSIRPNPEWGNFLATTSALLFACYLLIGRVVRRRSSWLAYVFPLYVAAALTILVYALVTGTILGGYSTRIYVLCALMALGPQLLGHGSFNYAVKYVPAAVLGAAGLVEPVLAGVWAWLLFDEVPGGLAIAGALVVLAALSVMYLYRAKMPSHVPGLPAESTGG